MPAAEGPPVFLAWQSAFRAAAPCDNVPVRNRAAKKDYTEESLYNYAIFMLGRRMRTVAELKRLMRGRAGHQPDCAEMVEAVTERLKQQRYLNDTNYAAAYAAMRRDNEKFGRMRVAHELKARGVHPELVAKTVAESYGEVDEAQQVRQFAARKRLAAPRNQKEAARIFRMMARAGFATRAILQWLRQAKVEEETLAQLEQEREMAESSGPEEGA
jgi:regulatory protein